MDENKVWTIGELITRLSEFPPDMLVGYQDSDYDDLSLYLNPEIEAAFEFMPEEFRPYYPSKYSDEKRKQRIEVVVLNHWEE